MPITQIPLYTGETPQRTQAPEAFSNNADAWLEYQAPLAANYNQLASEVNSIAESAQGMDDIIAQSVAENQVIQQDIDSKAQQVSADTTEVANNAQSVATNTQTVSNKAQQVSADADQVAQDKLAVANNTQTVLDAQNDVTGKAQQVSADAIQVAQDKLEVANNTQAVSDNTNQVSLDASQVAQDATQVASDKVDVASNAASAQQAATEAKQITGLDTVDEAVAQQAPGQVAAAVEQQSGGMNRYRQDSNGNWNMMVKVPMMTNKVFNDALGTNWTPESDPHPAFIRPDGTTMPWFEFGMYQASNDGRGNSVSAAYKDPYVSINYDTAKSKCSSMGSGWGLVSNAQWAAITLWCLANDYQPLGNTYYGYSHERSYLGGIRQDAGINGDASGSARILTGSGPVEFRHNKIMQGIADMAGNVWEWVDGLKTDGGQIFVATRERQDESDWTAQAAFLDDGPKLNSERTNTANTNVTWSSLGKSATYVENQLLQQLMIEPIEETGATLGKLYYNNDGERLPIRGGIWGSASNAGLAALALSDERTYSSSLRGFRPAYFE